MSPHLSQGQFRGEKVRQAVGRALATAPRMNSVAR
jgi:hypothetical protein